MTPPFIHLHVHSQYSLLDGQASVTGLVDKAMALDMPGFALTDHGNMFGIKELANYVGKVKKKYKGKIEDARKRLEDAPESEREALRPEVEAEIAKYERKLKFKPIFGCEMYVAKGSLTDRSDKSDKGRHLVVLAKNLKGYKNLIKIVSQAHTEGFYHHPRTDKEALAAHREGLIVCSACLGGEIPRLIATGQLEEADRQVKWFKDTFGDDYYIELQRHKTDMPGANRDTYVEQERVNPVLIELARKHDIKIIATNDSHFINAEDAESHDRLICISTNNYLSDPDRMRYTKQEWFKSQEEMATVFPDLPEALSNTMEILDKVEIYSIDHAPIMPFFEIPAEFGTEEEYRQRITEKDLFDEFTQDENGNVVLSPEKAQAKIDKLGGYDKLYRIKFEADYLAKLAYEGADRRYGSPLTPELEERIRFELYIMKTMGFPGYFLIVQDFINVARKELGVSVGPGRGSAAGSVVAYCLGITQVDPIKYDLLFERFLNPDRISLPDIDVDFDDDGRADVLHYVTDKYGEDKVAHIITFGTMAAKSAIKDVARVEQLPLPESNRLANLVPKRMPDGPDGKTLKTNLNNCYKFVPEFAPELSSRNPLITETLEYARRLEGNVRNTGVHACGVIICRDPITDWVPVATAVDKNPGASGNDKMIVTQYEGSIIEDTGLIKMDFLGLKTLSIIKEAIHNIKETRGIDVDIDAIDIADPKTYELYCQGNTTGTFQFESAGMQKYLRELQPSTFEDLIAMNALYRPGPMDYIPDFIARKHGRSPITYDIPIMEKYLKDTYGVTVYQEQVMLLSRLLANFTRGQSDSLRKAMGKKLIDKMNELEALFMEGGQANGHDPKVLQKIWADWKKFASYAFNKSHATCYSWVAFQTAWLKANYPSEYMAAILTRNRSDITKLTGFMDECKRMHIRVLGPDVNESFMEFGVNKQGDIRFGLAAIKGVGEGVVKSIIAERDAGGPFESVYEFVERVPSGTVNRRTLENLVLAGAFDSFDGMKREDFFGENAKGEAFSEVLVRYGQAFHNDKMSSAMSLFGDDADMATAGRPPVTPAPEWPMATKLEKERELVGMYLSAHPLDPYYMELTHGTGCTVKHFSEMEPVEGMDVKLGGMVIDFQTRQGKNGPFGIMKIEDYTGSTEFMLFGQTYIDFHNYGVPGTPILISGQFQRRFANSDIRFNIKTMQLLQDMKGKLVRNITIDIETKRMNGFLKNLIEEASAADGVPTGELAFRVFDPGINRVLHMSSGRRIHITRALVDALDDEQISYTIND
ncbi:DNA polymerase III subunit alpha [Duncaniella muricolitica]|uniref:DNA polymerase III subunit alpha n=1 Tax=Duncaniella muricolitica TaxID=2880704 RepID=UPI00244E00B1|nr:DNA polymerase III subunit alpha [Duncaniella muricolitica]